MITNLGSSPPTSPVTSPSEELCNFKIALGDSLRRSFHDGSEMFKNELRHVDKLEYYLEQLNDIQSEIENCIKEREGLIKEAEAEAVKPEAEAVKPSNSTKRPLKELEGIKRLRQIEREKQRKQNDRELLLAEIKDELNNIKDQLREADLLRNQNDDLQGELCSLQNELDASKRENATLRRENATLKEKLKKATASRNETRDSRLEERQHLAGAGSRATTEKLLEDYTQYKNNAELYMKKLEAHNRILNNQVISRRKVDVLTGRSRNCSLVGEHKKT